MTSVARQLAADIERELSGHLSLLESLVNIDSGSYYVSGVNAVIDLVADQLARLGFAIERTPIAGRGDQMTARRSLGSGPRLLILGHADTVWPAGTAAEWPFARTGERLTGPGVGDMKGGVISAIFALKCLLARGLKGLGS